jgi:hypothetical protein
MNIQRWIELSELDIKFTVADALKSTRSEIAFYL